ncbi:unnamed protein product [Rotaria magnacalcarata]|uniref:G-protein coupled receptors family 1 profile domain-containing protein n=1 Tax=Rotaria magnacalcarata TaxID=392030 RepID=A0A816WTH8_9BILA|nr:unnamed protein product [Rotaria magnacalcarata]
MSENNTTNTTESMIISPSTYPVQFGILLSLQIPSALCFLFIFFNLCFVPRHRLLVHRLINHAVLCLVVNDFLICTTELPFTLVLLYRGVTAFINNTFCLVWFFYGYTTSTVSLFLLAWISVERYFLVFHKVFLKRHLFIGHYLPLLLCIFYPCVFYAGVLFIYKCENEFNYEQWGCASGCYQNNYFLGTYDWVINTIVPSVIVILMNALLFGRVAYQKYLMKQTRMLNKNKKLILQLLLCVVIYLSTWFPFFTLGIILVYIPDNELMNNLYQYIFNYTIYVMPLLSPFLALITLSDLTKKRSQAVEPQATLIMKTLRMVPTVANR